MENKIVASFIIEIMGRPKEYVEENLKKLIEKLGEEKGVNVTDYKTHEPRKLEIIKTKEDAEKLKKLKEKFDKVEGITLEEDLYTSFAEVETELEDINSLLVVAFNYMPSNIEISNPENFLLKNSDISAILTNLILRLHRYDEIAKRLTIENSLIKDKLKEFSNKKDKKS